MDNIQLEPQYFLRHNVGWKNSNYEPVVDPNEILQEGADLEELALRHVRYNGRNVDQTIYEGQFDEARERELEAENTMEEGNDDGETPRTRNRRCMESNPDEFSDPDHWAQLHHGQMDWDDCERMLAFSRANQIRLQRAIEPLQQRRCNAEVAGEWEETADYSRAMAEIQSLQSDCGEQSMLETLPMTIQSF